MTNNDARKRRPIPPLSDADEAAIQREIAADPDAPEATDEQLAQGKPFAEVFPDLAASIRKKKKIDAGPNRPKNLKR